MKRSVLLLSVLVIGMVLPGCQADPESAATAVPTEMPQPAGTEPPAATSTPEPTPTPEPTATPTPSLEEIYGVPAGWRFVHAEPDNEGALWTAAVNGFKVALPLGWTCHERPDDTATTYYCILDEEEGPFANETKTTLRITSFWWDGATALPDMVPDYEEGQAFYGSTCESTYFTVDGLEAASVACTNPAYDDQLDYENDREAYGEARSQIPDFFVLILNGDRVDQLHFRTWDLSQMPSLFEEIVPHIHYDVEG